MTLAALTERLSAAGCVDAMAEAAIILDAAATAVELEAMAARRVAGEPLAHVVGWVEFRGRRFVVEPGVFVPRTRSEFPPPTWGDGPRASWGWWDFVLCNLHAGCHVDLVGC